MNCIGLDIGTSSICVCALNTQTGGIIESLTFANNFGVAGAKYERKQNAAALVEKCVCAVDLFIEKYTPVCGIGITGQMHGIVYFDKNCDPVSDLFTWQDMSALQKNAHGVSYSEELSLLSGYNISPGYGATTFFCHNSKKEVPEKTAGICTIHDLVAAKLAGLDRPVMHSSDAHSIGLYDINNGCFDKAAAAKAGLDPAFFPDVVNDAVIIGRHKGIPVCCALGDNQASFAGSVRDVENSVLLNFGTGSQISFLTDKKYSKSIDNAEIRPYHKESSLFAGFALCGGRAFSLLEKFIRSVLSLSGTDFENAYPFIDKALENSVEPEDPLKVRTTFSGTRTEPGLKGAVENIGTENFTALHLIYGVLHGMTDELAQIYKKSGHPLHKYIVGSGNGLRKNKALQQIIGNTFGLEIKIPLHTEEAAYGACLYAMTAAGVFNSLNDAQKIIKYI